ncbi:MAG: SirB2 family protein [Arenimonas sp.]
MLEYYAQVKAVHIAAVLASGGLFLLRGLLLQRGPASPTGRFAMATPVRLASYSIDTVLLTAALMLATMLPAAMFANGWLTAKLLLLPLYIVLGIFAFKRGRTSTLRRACFVAALLVFGCMLAIARMHQPLAPIMLLTGSLPAP